MIFTSRRAKCKRAIATSCPLDGYASIGNQAASQADYIAILAGQTTNYWVVRMVFVTKLGTLGRRKIIMADWAGARRILRRLFELLSPRLFAIH